MLVVKVPLRISFFGGGTDIPRFIGKIGYGQVISCTFNRYLYICINKRFDSQIRVSYSKTEIVNWHENLEHDIIREVLHKFTLDRRGKYSIKGLEIILCSDVPSRGTGLGSSSALTVGLIKGLLYLMGEHYDTYDIADNACRLEIDILGKPQGKQDAFAVAFGGLNKLVFPNAMDVEITAIPRASQIFEHLCLIRIPVEKDTDAILKSYKPKIDILKKMRNQVDVAEKFFRYWEWELLGAELKKAWEYKKQLSPQVSNKTVEAYIKRLEKIGACGYKLLGAGSGGFLLGVLEDPKIAISEFGDKVILPKPVFEGAQITQI